MTITNIKISNPIMPIEKVTRTQTKIRCGLSAVSGAGKTYSALILAYGLCGDWSKICLIDTENESSRAYAHLGDFSILALKPDFTPEKFEAAIKEAENEQSIIFEVIIIDSLSAVWEGQGGVLELVEQQGSKFGAWKEMTPRYNRLVNAILYSPRHIITTVKRKAEHMPVTDPSTGKVRITKVGTKEIIRDGFEYLLTINIELDMEHRATILKDRTEIFKGEQSFIIIKSTGEKIREWCEKGIDPLDVEIYRTTSTDAIQVLYYKTIEGIQLNIPEAKRDEAIKQTIKKFRRWNMIHTQSWIDLIDTFTVPPELSSYSKERKTFFINFPELQKIIRVRMAKLKGEPTEELNLTDDYKDLNDQTRDMTAGGMVATGVTVNTGNTGQIAVPPQPMAMSQTEYEKVLEDLNRKKTLATMEKYMKDNESRFAASMTTEQIDGLAKFVDAKIKSLKSVKKKK